MSFDIFLTPQVYIIPNRQRLLMTGMVPSSVRITRPGGTGIVANMILAGRRPARRTKLEWYCILKGVDHMHRKWFLISLLLAIGLSFGGIQAASMSPAKSLQSALLGDKIVISALSNRQKAPAVAFNSKHGEYLVVWHNLWSNPSAREIWASRVSSQASSRLVSRF